MADEILRGVTLTLPVYTVGGPPPSTTLKTAPDRRLAGVLLCSCLFVLLSSVPFQSYVMPHLNENRLSLAERIRSPKFGDSYGYARYAEGILQHGALTKIDGTPILKHMPGLPLLLALVVKAFGSVRPFLVFQIVFFFISLYFFLARVGPEFARLPCSAHRYF
jgi:hypothetical protein